MQREAPIQRAIVAWLRTVLPGAIVHHAKGEIKQRGRSIARALALWVLFRRLGGG